MIEKNIDYVYLSEEKDLELRKAMDIYYHSRLARQIKQGTHGMENMDYKYLVEDLIENECELFQN